MLNAERRPELSRGRVIALAMLAALAVTYVEVAAGDVAPIEHNGYLQYQFRTSRSELGAGSRQHLATWRTSASTFVWRPYILLLEGDLGLTRVRSENSTNREKSTIVTGSIAADLFARSTFPFRIYYQSSDSRVDGDVFTSDFSMRNWGFMQQLASRRTNGRLALEYRNSETDEISVNGRTEARKFSSEMWQLTGNQTMGRNDFRLLTSLLKNKRDLPAQARDRTVVSLRHQFRGSLRFNIDDTLFFSDERLNLHGNGSEQFRRFLQFNGYSNWRPDTAKPLTVIGRLVAQGVEAGNGTTHSSNTYLISGAATYQYSPQLTLAASAGVDGSESDNSERRNGAFQRIRGTYRGVAHDLGWSDYNWGSSLDLLNRSIDTEGEGSQQTVGASFNHGLSRSAAMAGGRQFQIGVTQTASALADTLDRREQSLVHTAYATINRQRGRTSSYLRFSASDRRLYGDRRDEFQLFSLQGSSRMQMDRTRSLNGSFTVQVSNSASPMMMMNGETAAMRMMDTESFTYGISLSYADRELFEVHSLSFLSELRYFSAEFRDDDDFSRVDRFDPSRSSSSWRNELTYTIGLLELRLLASVFDVDGRWNSQAFFSVRRYYGT